MRAGRILRQKAAHRQPLRQPLCQTAAKHAHRQRLGWRAKPQCRRHGGKQHDKIEQSRRQSWQPEYAHAVQKGHAQRSHARRQHIGQAEAQQHHGALQFRAAETGSQHPRQPGRSRQSQQGQQQKYKAKAQRHGAGQKPQGCVAGCCRRAIGIKACAVGESVALTQTHQTGRKRHGQGTFAEQTS